MKLFRKHIEIGDCVIDKYGTIAIVIENDKGNILGKSIMNDTNFGETYDLYSPRLILRKEEVKYLKSIKVPF